jgi:hypothetical protein
MNSRSEPRDLLVRWPSGKLVPGDSKNSNGDEQVVFKQRMLRCAGYASHHTITKRTHAVKKTKQKAEEEGEKQNRIWRSQSQANTAETEGMVRSTIAPHTHPRGVQVNEPEIAANTKQSQEERTGEKREAVNRSPRGAVLTFRARATAPSTGDAIGHC